MAVGALGPDSGVSCRIRAALCGIVGYKPTARRIPTDGVLPLSFTVDSVGPLAPTVACCAALDAVMAGEEPDDLAPCRIDGLRLAAPQAVVLDSLEPAVASAYAGALSRLAKAGAKIVDLPLIEFNDIAILNRQGGLSASEAHSWHPGLIATQGNAYRPPGLLPLM